MRLKRITSVFALLLVASLLVNTMVGSANSSDGNHYTYTYDCWDIDRESPDAYSVSRIITGSDFACGNFKEPHGIYTCGTDAYIVDTGNNRLVQLRFANDQFTFVREIKSFTNLQGRQDTFKNPEDCFVGANGDIYVADTQNGRIVHMDKDLKAIKMITKPDDETYTEKNFYPQKLVVDNALRVFAQVQNVNKGFMEFDSQGEFTGYVGASEVTYDFLDYLWKMVASKEQKAQLEQFVPTEYSNICLDSEGFIYATISTFDDAIEDVKPIRKLNAKGTDILVRNGYVDPYGDLYYTDAGEMKGPSKLNDICCLDNDIYYALDTNKGRVFAYDFQGNMLYAFGGHGYKAGYFMQPSAIEDFEDSLLVVDQQLGSITQFTRTRYGKLIDKGLSEYKKGDYESSASTWKEVLKLNGNYDQAYIGIGRALLREKKYKKAMSYFELKLDAKNYSKAYKLYRKEWFEKNIGMILLVLVILIVLGLGWGFVKRAREEVKKG